MRITPNLAACIKAIRLVRKGNPTAALGLIADCTKKDMNEALAIIEEKALWADKFEEIAQRHHARKGETMTQIMERAAAAGDEEAKAMIDFEILDRRIY
jgi:hypothetical protein